MPAVEAPRSERQGTQELLKPRSAALEAFVILLASPRVRRVRLLLLLSLLLLRRLLRLSGLTALQAFLRGLANTGRNVVAAAAAAPGAAESGIDGAHAATRYKGTSKDELVVRAACEPRQRAK